MSKISKINLALLKIFNFDKNEKLERRDENLGDYLRKICMKDLARGSQYIY